MELAAILAMLKLLLPGIGAVLKQIPVISNKYIPLILTIFASVKNYWILAGLPTEYVPPAVVEGEPTLAGVGWLWANPITQGAIAIVWGRLDSYLAQSVHRARKYRPMIRG